MARLFLYLYHHQMMLWWFRCSCARFNRYRYYTLLIIPVKCKNLIIMIYNQLSSLFQIITRLITHQFTWNMCNPLRYICVFDHHPNLEKKEILSKTNNFNNTLSRLIKILKHTSKIFYQPINNSHNQSPIKSKVATWKSLTKDLIQTKML